MTTRLWGLNKLVFIQLLAVYIMLKTCKTAPFFLSFTQQNRSFKWLSFSK